MMVASRPASLPAAAANACITQALATAGLPALAAVS